MTGFALKLMAIVAMTIDHIGYVFFPEQMIWRLVGRLAFPIFAYMAAEGAFYTRDRKRYLLRLLLWAVVSEIPFDLMGNGAAFSPEAQNVCWTLAAGVACVFVLENKGRWRYTAVAFILLLTLVFMTDYPLLGAAAVMIIYHYNRKGQKVRGTVIAGAVLSTLFGPLQLAGILAALPIYFYNGKQGPRIKYLFYTFYPAHMLVIWGVSQLILLP